MTTNDNPLFTPEEACGYLNLMKDGQDKDGNATKVPDLDALNRRRRAGLFKINKLSEREWRVYKSELDTYLKGGNSDKEVDNGGEPGEETPESVEREIKLVEKKRELHIKQLELEVTQANYKSLDEYMESLKSFEEAKAELVVREQAVTERERAAGVVESSLIEREQELQKGRDGIEAERVEILEEAQKQAKDLIARTKVEVQTKENSEFDNMEWAAHELETVQLTMNAWGYYDFGDDLGVKINWLFDKLDENATLPELWNDFKQACKIITNLMEFTQSQKNAHQTVDLRNELGRQLNGIVVVLHLDDERRGNKKTPA